MQSNLPYRPCVGIMLFNREGLVFIGQRKDLSPEGAASPYAWQMPQGGIDEGEDPLTAAKRELLEETGVRHVALLGEAEEWLFYDLPDKAAWNRFSGKYKGQKQKWFAFRFGGEESEINIANPLPGHQPEFQDWRWERIERIVDLVIPFKREVYAQVVRMFEKFSRRDE